MDFIDLVSSNEDNGQKTSPKGTIAQLPPPLLPPVEDFQGRLSVSGDPFEKMLTQVALADDPFECLTRIRLPTGELLANSVSDPEAFFQGNFQILSPNFDCNNTFLSCDISPIMDLSSSDQPSCLSVFNRGFLLTSRNSDNNSVGMRDNMTKTSSGSEESDKKSSEEKDRSVTVPASEGDGAKLREKNAWHCALTDEPEDIMQETPPRDMLDMEEEEDSLEQLKIPMLEHLSLSDNPTATSPEALKVSDKDISVSLNSSAVVDDLRRRMKDVLNKRISPGSMESQDKINITPELKGITRDKTFDIDPSQSIFKKTEENPREEKKEEDSGDTFMEKLMEMCGEHNVSIVQNSADNNSAHNKSMIVVVVNDSSKTSQLQRRKSFSSEIPRVVVDSPKRRRSVTSGPSTQNKPETPKQWKPPVRVLPSPQFRGKSLKLRTTDVNKAKITSGPMRAVRPQVEIKLDENITPPERIVSKRRSLVATSTPLNLKKHPVGASTPQGKLPEKKSNARHLLDSNKLNPRVSFSTK